MLDILWAGYSAIKRLQYQTAKAYKQHNKILLDIVHDELNLNLVYALSTRSLCQTKIMHDA